MNTDKAILPQDPEHQSNDEWLQSYDSATAYRQASNSPVRLPQSPSEAVPRHNTLTGGYQYIGHRTTKQGRVVLEFAHIETGILAVRFFNVELRTYRVGEHGQFTTRPRHKFRRFWLHMIGQQPRSWSRVHQQMHLLKELRYNGLATYRHTANSSYWNLEKVRKL